MHKNKMYRSVNDGNVTYVFFDFIKPTNIRKQEGPKSLYDLQRDRINIRNESELHKRIYNGDYAGAAIIAEVSGDNCLKDSICEEGINRYHKLLANIKKEESWTAKQKDAGQGIIYGRMADLLRVWGKGFEKLEGMYRKLSRELKGNAHSYI